MTTMRSILLIIILNCCLEIGNIYGQTRKINIQLPNVVGMKLSDAEKALKNNRWEIGAIIYNAEIEKSDSLIIYRQNPTTLNNISKSHKRKNRVVDLWVTNPNNPKISVQKPKRKVIAIIRKDTIRYNFLQ